MRKALLRPGVVAALGAGLLVLSACSPGESGDSSNGDGGEPESQSIDWDSFEGDKLDYVYFTDGPDEAVTRDLIGQFE